MEGSLPEPFGSEDLRVLSKYQQAGHGSWTTMSPPDKDAYLRIHTQLEQILTECLASVSNAPALDSCVTLGFDSNAGVRGTRPKDLWCAIFSRGAEAYMPQVYLIVSHRGIELGYAAAIHRGDFSNPNFKATLKVLAPQIFDALPEPISETAQRLSRELAAQRNWYFRKKARLATKENDFVGLEDFLTFLKSTSGKHWGAGAIARYWLPHELTGEVDLAKEFANAVALFSPLMVRAKPLPMLELTPSPELPSVGPSAKLEEGISEYLERFMTIYPDRRSRPFATDEELWSVLKNLQKRFKALPQLMRRPTIGVSWSVGKGNWAGVPWIAFLDRRVTTTTESGLFVVLLFREDMSGVYITFNQGVTEPKEAHGATAGLQLLRETAADLRRSCNHLGQLGFRLDSEIDLRTSGTRGRDYEAGTVAYKLYERGDVPDDPKIAEDLDALLAVYDRQITPQLDDKAPKVEAEARPIAAAPPYTMNEALADVFLEEDELEDLPSGDQKRTSSCKARQVSARPLWLDGLPIY